MRAVHAIWETAGATLPASFVVTPAMIEQFNWKVVYVVLGWVATVLLAGVLSLAKSIFNGVPEVKCSKKKKETEV